MRSSELIMGFDYILNRKIIIKTKVLSGAFIGTNMNMYNQDNQDYKEPLINLI